MKHVLIYEDTEGNCRIIVPGPKFQQAWEDDEQSIARLHEIAIPCVVEFIACDPSLLPKDLTFRDAWAKGTAQEPIKIRFQKALEIHRGRLKEACQYKITQLTEQLNIALEKDDLPQSVAIRRTIHILRSLHEVTDLTHCKTVDDIKRSIPHELHDVWKWYDPEV